jgi:hypothetical protein
MRFMWWLSIILIFIGTLSVFEGVYIPITILKNREIAESLDNFTMHKCEINVFAINTCNCSVENVTECFSYEYKLVKFNKTQIVMYPCDYTTNLTGTHFCYINNNTIELFFPNYCDLTTTNKFMIGLLFPAVAISCAWGIAYPTYKKNARRCCYKKPRQDINEKQLDDMFTVETRQELK